MREDVVDLGISYELAAYSVNFYASGIDPSLLDFVRTLLIDIGTDGIKSIQASGRRYFNRVAREFGFDVSFDFTIKSFNYSSEIDRFIDMKPTGSDAGLFCLLDLGSPPHIINVSKPYIKFLTIPVGFYYAKTSRSTNLVGGFSRRDFSVVSEVRKVVRVIHPGFDSRSWVRFFTENTSVLKKAEDAMQRKVDSLSDLLVNDLEKRLKVEARYYSVIY